MRQLIKDLISEFNVRIRINGSIYQLVADNSL
jgi:hypothetical protein